MNDIVEISATHSCMVITVVPTFAIGPIVPSPEHGITYASIMYITHACTHALSHTYTRVLYAYIFHRCVFVQQSNLFHSMPAR